jgi:hypothetical protein
MSTRFTDLARLSISDSLKDRWHVPDWKAHFPWWITPAQCRILFYTDGVAHLQGGSFQGLTYVKTLLEAHPYFYVNFVIDVCHRNGTDPTATIFAGTAKKLTELDIMNKYDEIWFFGVDGGASLTAAEVTLMDQFMAAPKNGGVLTTGDHASLGQGLSGQIKRVGQMRLYPAPDSVPPGWNTTLVQRAPAAGEPADPPGPGQALNFNDQSDDIPQSIRWRRYPVGIFHGRPHPVLCGPSGPIDVLPDHEHEGEALAPAVAGDSNWPSGVAGQEAPEVIAWGRIKDPNATNHGHEIGVISAYNGHMVDVGRIVADSTWHHWFDINLIGLAGSGPPYTGFAATPAGQAALKKIDAYYLNCGVWLAPPSVQTAMRNAAFWSIIWQDIVVELPLKASLLYWGRAGIDALGRRAGRCAIFDWVWPKEPIYKPKIPWWEWRMVIPELGTFDIPVEQYLAGGAVRELAATFGYQSGKRSITDRPPAAAEIERARARGADAGIAALKEDMGRQHGLVTKLMEQDFSARGLRTPR